VHRCEDCLQARVCKSVGFWGLPDNVGDSRMGSGAGLLVPYLFGGHKVLVSLKP